MRGIFIDTETGGLDPKRDALLSLAAVAFEIDKQGAWVLDDFSVMIQPGEFTSVSLKALSLQGESWSGLEHSKRIPEQEALLRFSEWLRDYPSIPFFAHHASLDRDFLAEANRRSAGGIDSRTVTGRHAPWVCTIVLANWNIARGVMSMPANGLSLDSLSDALGVMGRTSTGGHNALEDARIGVRILAELSKM